MKSFFLSVFMIISGVFSPVYANTEVNPPAIIPQPSKMEITTGSFSLTPQTAIVTDRASSVTAKQLAEYLKPGTGFSLKVASSRRSSKTTITLAEDASLSSLGKEGYRLSVTPSAIKISSADQAGLFHGVQTLRQLLPPRIFSATPVPNTAWTVPCVQIDDTPRFPWRGLMLDSGHDFQSKEFVLRFIDLMALHKFNVFHWHLTDLGTWSIEIKGRPKLLDADTRNAGVKPGHYTQDEIREVVRFAAARHITILPEIDMPGHEPPALIAYPELNCPVPQTGRPWQFCVGNEKTYAFLEEVLSQVADLFPGTYIHIGGDECPKDRWLICPICTEKMKSEHLANGEELQSYFIRRIEKFLQSKNRRLVGWDEILEGGLAPNATVMSWRGMGGGIAAAKAGHDVIMAPTEWTYFDYPNTTVEKVYSFEPIPKELEATQQAHVLGAQAQMWTDNHETEEGIDALVYPRAAALAEVVWSPVANRNYNEFATRLQSHFPRLAALGVHYNPMTSGTAVAKWSTTKTLETPQVMEWPITTGIAGAGRYKITFQYESGSSRLIIHDVAMVQGDKVLAQDKHPGSTGASDSNNAYHLELPALNASPLILRATVSTDRQDSEGRILIEKMP